MAIQMAIKASVPSAPQMRPAAQTGLNAAGSVIHVSEGKAIFAEGDETDLFYKVVSGVVRLCKFLSDGRRQIEAFHNAGDVFGLELGDEHMLSAEAVSGCTLIAYRRRTLELLSEKDKSVSRQLLQYAMQNMAQAQEHSLLLGRRGAAEKVASFLIAWAQQSPGGKVINLPMTRQDIADYLGLTIETVSRSFSQFERDGVIALPNIREVHVTDPEALQDLAA
jgi:CRP/FNR family nitrogen fixation transcriptional regulator